MRPYVHCLLSDQLLKRKSERLIGPDHFGLVLHKLKLRQRLGCRRKLGNYPAKAVKVRNLAVDAKPLLFRHD